MEKCKYYSDSRTMWGHGVCFADKETPPCFSNGDVNDCSISSSILSVETRVPAQSFYAPIDVNHVLEWIRTCNNLKELVRVKHAVYSEILHFNDPKDDDDFRSRA